jgi:V/A-type H+/Na+-transporting ATPase subunit E
MAQQRSSRKDTPVQVAAGVEELITRLRDQGVEAGRSEAGEIVAQAQAEAHQTLDQARQQAERIVADARRQAQNLEQSGKEALQLALRDAVLTMKTRLMERFRGEVRQLLGEEQQKQELLEKMILEVVGRVRPEADRSEQIEVLLPRRAAGLAELSQNPEELASGELTQFVRLVSAGMLREGVSFGVGREGQGSGLTLRLVDREVVLDLSDEAVAGAILEHLQPRFRALLEGVVK